MDTADMPQPINPGAPGLARLSTPGALGRPPIAVGLPPQAGGGGGGRLNLSPRMIWRAVLRHWWQALILWMVGTGALGAMVWMKFKPEYEAVGLLQVKPAEDDPFNTGRQVEAGYMNTQVQLVKSSNVLLATSIDPDVSGLTSMKEAKDGEAQLREMLEIRVPAGFLMRLTVRSKYSNEPAAIINAVMKHYETSDGAWTKSQTDPLLSRLENYRKILGDEIGEKKREVDEYVKQGRVDPNVLMGLEAGHADGEPAKGESSTKYSLTLQEYSKVRGELISLEFEIAQAEGLLEQEKLIAETQDPTIWIEEQIKREFRNDPEVIVLIREYKEAESQHAIHDKKIRKHGDATLRGLRGRIDDLKAMYDRLWEEKKGPIREMVEAAAVAPGKGLIQAEADVRKLYAIKQAKEEMLDKLDVENKGVAADTVAAKMAQEDLNHLKSMERQVQTEIRGIEFEQFVGGRIKVIDAARTSNVPLYNKRTKMLAVAPVAMLGLVVALCTLLELKGGRVGTPDELSARVPVEVFAVPPLPVVRPSRSLKAARSNDLQLELFVQQLDHLRVALCGEATSHPGRGRCVLITSATGGEGKTTLAAQLAVRCAEAGASTVLVDADLRRPTLGKLFEVPELPGLSDVLRGEANLEDALTAISQVGGCQLLPAGSKEANPNRILRGQRFEPMIEQLRRSFDVIIVDTSPVLPVPDALIMGRYADGVILAARHDRSRFPLVERANQLLGGAGVPVLGVVINGVRPSGMRYADYTYTPRTG